jgi:PTH1 family peptidyl-tRNA hydrolase
MKLIVGLGNPGSKYEKTRHNAGFMAVDFLRDQWNFPAFRKSDKAKAEVSEGEVFGNKILFVRPQTYMNLSGEAVQFLVAYFKIAPADLVVIYDDVDIAQGTVRVRPMGSAGGHNGIKSLIGSLGTEEFTRVRLGMAPLTPFSGKLEDYVLGRLSDEEKLLLEGNVRRLPDLIEKLFKDGIEEVMREYN